MRSLILTGNKFRRIGCDFFADKDINQLIHPHLAELVLIDMALDWQQIDVLAQVFVYVEQLHLVRNNCSVIFSQFQLPREHFKNMKFINLEANAITSWGEVCDFRHLPNLKRLTLNKNPIRRVVYKPGWQELQMLSMEDCLLDDWHSFDQLNEFAVLKQLRVNNNPIMQKELGGERAREIAIARVQFVYVFNGSTLQDSDRRDYEIYYMNDAFRQFLLAIGDESQPPNSLEDERL